MREPYTQLYVHLVWATWDRLPLLTESLRSAVYACIQAECIDLKVEVLAMGGIADHVHLLVRFPAALSVSDLVKQVKGSSSHLVTQRLCPGDFFKWQGAYGAFSVSKTEVQRIVEYISNQEKHHRDNTLLPEYELELMNPSLY